MAKDLVIRNLNAVLSNEVVLPTLTRYNRLESRPRTDNFTRAMRAEVRDALWMLCKQWQMGEFLGDDAGTPVYAKIQVEGQRLTKYQPVGEGVENFDNNMPLEATVERRPLIKFNDSQTITLDLRLQMGQRWLKMIPTAGVEFKTKYPIEKPNPTIKDHAPICAHTEVWQAFEAVAGRAMDGAALYAYLKQNVTHLASDGIGGLSPTDKNIIDEAGKKFVAWFEKLYTQPANGDAWQPEKLEYQFACAVPDGAGGEKVLAAEEYYHDRLDWYSFDWDKARPSLDEVPESQPQPVEKIYTKRSFIPTPVRFNGMPDTRWWAFEDGKTNFGDIKPNTTDLAKLLLVEFGLVYANDWFVLPYTVPSGSVLNIKGLSVTNTFGERFWIDAAGRGDDEDWQRWNLFSLNIKARANDPADLTLLVLPTVPKVQESPPTEVINLLRDEMANMVWGLETTVPMPHGWPRAGNVAAEETRLFLQKLLDENNPTSPPPTDWKAPLRYDVMTTVPENWIPFVAEHIGGGQRQIQLRRGAMPRFLENENPPTFERVRPRTTLLREGLDQIPAQPYHLHEEEVPHAGVQVMQTFQRTRWLNGEVVTWLGVKKRTGRGEGHSGLTFDRIVEVKK